MYSSLIMTVKRATRSKKSKKYKVEWNELEQTDEFTETMMRLIQRYEGHRIPGFAYEGDEDSEAENMQELQDMPALMLEGGESGSGSEAAADWGSQTMAARGGGEESGGWKERESQGLAVEHRAAHRVREANKGKVASSCCVRGGDQALRVENTSGLTEANETGMREASESGGGEESAWGVRAQNGRLAVSDDDSETRRNRVAKKLQSEAHTADEGVCGLQTSQLRCDAIDIEANSDVDICELKPSIQTKAKMRPIATPAQVGARECTLTRTLIYVSDHNPPSEACLVKRR
ncbi:MAG: hypothetical protein SGPRY_013307 [Prymnesium sp.]